ncbi:hypothetical protein ElyMa_004773900 [Elysia marginata]|uniref:Uncharacterized protein n=1 Tax=Elysia marginata TaxID=1093978 RepID=A0AAV4IHG0_9GAST|nr:hypothetical protein ElyMa_004773900 [Elysia marginata]
MRNTAFGLSTAALGGWSGSNRGSKLLRGINHMTKWVYQNKFVSFLLFMSGSVIFAAVASDVHTPTAPERVEWRRKRQMIDGTGGQRQD